MQAMIAILGYLAAGYAISVTFAYFDRDASSTRPLYNFGLVFAWPFVLPVFVFFLLFDYMHEKKVKVPIAPWRVGMRLAKKRNQLRDARDVLKGGKNVSAGS